MKNLKTLLLSALFCLLGVEANAFTLFVDVDNTDNLSDVSTYFNGEKTPLDLTAPMPVKAEYPDQGGRYLYITPKAGCFITEITVKDEDGAVLSTKSGAWKTMQLVSIQDKYDYGTVYIKTSDQQPLDSKFTVNLNGNPYEVSLYLGATRSVELKKGSQEIAYYSGTESTVYIVPLAVDKLYKVTLDGEEVEARLVSGEGKMSYQYSFKVKNGSVVDIETDYPEQQCNCKIVLGPGMENFIQSVIAAGEPLDDYKEFSVQMGSKLIIKANTDDYDVEKFMFNDRPSSFSLGEWDALIESDAVITIEGKAIERPLKATFITYNWQVWDDESSSYYEYEIRRKDPQKEIVLHGGENTVTFNETEMPFSMRFYLENQNDMRVALNGERIYTSDYSPTYSLNLKDGDIVQLGAGVDLPPLPSAITAAKSDSKSQDSPCYNTMGQKVNAPQRGIYIKDSKKIIVK